MNLRVKGFNDNKSIPIILIFLLSLLLASCGDGEGDGFGRNGDGAEVLGPCSENIISEYEYVAYACENVSGSSADTVKDSCLLSIEEFTSKHPNLSCLTAEGEKIDEDLIETKYLDPIVSYNDDINNLFDNL